MSEQFWINLICRYIPWYMARCSLLHNQLYHRTKKKYLYVCSLSMTCCSSVHDHQLYHGTKKKVIFKNSSKIRVRKKSFIAFYEQKAALSHELFTTLRKVNVGGLFPKNKNSFPGTIVSPTYTRLPASESWTSFLFAQ